jgi:hypothetical protein
LKAFLFFLIWSDTNISLNLFCSVVYKRYTSRFNLHHMIICRRNHCINGIKIHYRCQAFETRSRQTLDGKWKRDFHLEKCNVLAVTRNIDRCLSFCPFSFGHYVLYRSSIYGFWQPLLVSSCLYVYVPYCRNHNPDLSSLKRDFHLEKCNVLAVTRNINMIKFNYTFHGHPLESLEHVKCQISLSNIYNVWKVWRYQQFRLH